MRSNYRGGLCYFYENMYLKTDFCGQIDMSFSWFVRFFFYQRTWQIKRVYNSYFLIIPEIKVDLKKKQLLYCILTLKQKWRNWQQKKNKKNEYLNNKTICKFWYLLIANIIKTTFNASLLLWGVGKKLNEWRDYND